MGITDNIQSNGNQQSSDEKLTKEEWVVQKRAEEAEKFRIAKYIEAKKVPTDTFTIVSSLLIIESNRDTSSPTGLGGEPLERLKLIMQELHKNKFTFRVSTFCGKLGEAVFLKGGFNNEAYLPFDTFEYAHGNDMMDMEARQAQSALAEEKLNEANIYSEPTIDALQHTTKQWISKWKKTTADFVKANRMFRTFLSMVPFLTFGEDSNKMLGLCLYYSEIGNYDDDYKEVNSKYDKLAELAKEDGVANENAKGYSIDNCKNVLDTVKNIAYDGVTCINLNDEDCVEQVSEAVKFIDGFSKKSEF